jgi:thiomorpholine-carboxylate dehydrogenase
MTAMPLWLTESDVRALLDPAALVDAMEAGLAAFSRGEIVQPVRTAFDIGERSFFIAMPAFDGRRGILGAKLVTVAPANAARGLDTHLATIALFDSESGELAAIMDGRYITEVRTAAASAVSVRRLARADAHVFAILGAGVQARSHLEILQRISGFDDIRVWSPTPERLEHFTADAGRPVHAARSAEEAVRGADVILLATNSVTPVIENQWVDAGAHVIALGACRPTQREIDPALLARSRLFVDSRAAAFQESGDIFQAIREGWFTEEHVRAELGEVITGRHGGRDDSTEVTLFKSLGLAIEDLIAAGIVYRCARETGRGLKLPL